MALDHHDGEAVQRFCDEVDEALDRTGSGLEPWTLRLLGMWLAGGVASTLGVLTDGALSTALYLVAFAAILWWVVGFYDGRIGGTRLYPR